MGSFQLDSSPNLFLLAPDTKSLWVWELKVPHSSDIEPKNWVYKHSIGTKFCDYTSITLHATQINGSNLEDLAEDLYFSHLIVNYQGYSYLDTALIGDLSFTPQFYRLNDLFSWSKYTKLDPLSIDLTVTSSNINWDRCDFRNGSLVLVSIKPQICTENESSARIAELKEQNQLLSEKLKKANKDISIKDELIIKLREKLKRCRREANPDSSKIVEKRKLTIGPLRFEYAEVPLKFKAPLISGPRLTLQEILPVFMPLDENVRSRFPRYMYLYVDRDEDFDRTGWSFIKAENVSTMKESMIAFYEGNHENVNVNGDVVRVPYSIGKVFSSTRKIFLGDIQGIGKVLAFLYDEEEEEEEEEGDVNKIFAQSYSGDW
ncbi:unnamed protein product [Amaranthus hypochondriacus]